MGMAVIIIWPRQTDVKGDAPTSREPPQNPQLSWGTPELLTYVLMSELVVLSHHASQSTHYFASVFIFYVLKSSLFWCIILHPKVAVFLSFWSFLCHNILEIRRDKQHLPYCLKITILSGQSWQIIWGYIWGGVQGNFQMWIMWPLSHRAPQLSRRLQDECKLKINRIPQTDFWSAHHERQSRSCAGMQGLAFWLGCLATASSTVLKLFLSFQR